MDVEKMILKALEGKVIKSVTLEPRFHIFEFTDGFIYKVETPFQKEVLEYQFTTVEAMARGIPDD